MGTDLYEALPEYKSTIDRASEVLGYDLSDVMKNADKLHKRNMHNLLSYL